ncbi:hypothetical protein IKF30_00480 [Candidatus Saccharibacteria bacterium]|nr:hypothetical protein [Candidatus Saccharibacteria bacterium]
MRKLSKHKKLERGGKNLVILGVASVLIAAVTTSVALAIYHNSGDIYLDRSRPGFLPDEDEVEDENDKVDDEEYDFTKDGQLTKEDMDEFLKHLKEEIQAIDDYKNPFGEEVLSDERLGIPAEEKKVEEVQTSE